MTSTVHYKASIWPPPLTYPEKKHCKGLSYEGVVQQKWKSSHMSFQTSMHFFIMWKKMYQCYDKNNLQNIFSFCCLKLKGKKDMLIGIFTAELFINGIMCTNINTYLCNICSKWTVCTEKTGWFLNWQQGEITDFC